LPSIGTPSTTVIVPRRIRGSYLAPDKFTEEIELVTRDDVIEARRLIGADRWVRFAGGMRWVATEPDTESANELLTLVQTQPGSWTGPDNRSSPGYCRFDASSTLQAVERSMSLDVDPTSAMSVSIFVATNVIAVDPPDWGAPVGSKMSYTVDPEADVTIKEPTIETGAVTAQEALYRYRRLYCGEGLCAPRIVAETHAGTDIFCIENGGELTQFTMLGGEVETRGGCDALPENNEPGPPRPTSPPPLRY